MDSVQRKRPLPKEYEDISSISGPETKAKVHGIVTSLSPIKPSAKRPFFEGFLTDGNNKIRFVGFSSNKEKVIEKFSEQKDPVLLANCSSKNRKYSDGLELIIGDQTTITISRYTR